MAGEQEWRMYEVQNMGERIVVQAALRSLLASHPDPAALRTIWAQLMTQMWQEYPAVFGNIPQAEKELLVQSMQRALAAYETHLPPVAE